MATTQEVSHAKPKAPKKAKPTPAEQVAKMRQAVLDVTPPTVDDEFVNVPLELIDCDEQVRTLFFDGSIAEMAADIAARGVIQPILLRPGQDGRFIVIAGERRLRASRLASLVTIPAILRNVDVETSRNMQLAENIQREDLSLQDTAGAVKELYKQFSTVQAVADFCHKSKAWVSKHLAIANGLKGYAARLLDDGVTEDLEILQAVAKIEELTPGTNTAWALCEKLRAGTAGRTDAREALTAAKDAADPVKRQQREQEREEKYRADVEARNEEQKKWARQQEHEAQRVKDERAEMLANNPKYLLNKIEDELEAEDGRPVHEIIASISTETLELLEHHLELLSSAGTGATADHILRMHAQGEYTICEMAAYLQGFMGHDFGVRSIMTSAKNAMRRE